MNSEVDERNILERKDFGPIAAATLRDVIGSPPAPEEAMNYAVRLSSGTTGGSLLVGMHRTSALTYRVPLTKRWYAESDRTLYCFGPVSLRLFSILDAQKFGKDALYLPIDVADLTEGITPLLADFAPDKILGIPSYVIHAAPYMDTKTRSNVRAINVYGELLTKTLQDMIANFFPNAKMRSLYAISEVGAISTVSCDYQEPNRYHPRPGVTVEIHDPDTEGVGDLLVSMRLNQIIPVQRYRTGDMAKMHEAPCPCGEKNTFEILGRRGYDYIKLVGVTLRQEECERVAKLLHAFDDYRLEASNVAEGPRLKGKIILRIFRKDGVGTKDLAHEIGERFSRELYLTPTRTLADLVAEGICAPLSVEFVEEPFPQKHKDIKLIERQS
jgi:phenylacetate-coenzyme A ligase PaaK-like adenylate-forming protein